MSYVSITVRKKKLSSNFELRSEFREASRESLVLTGTPSVRNLKFRMRLHCAGNPSHCKRLRVLRRLLYSRACVGTPNAMVQSII